MEGKNTTESNKVPEVVKTEAEFWYTFIDAKNQFMGINFALRGNMPFAELKELNKTVEYLPFTEYIKKFNKVLAPEVLNNVNCVNIIKTHDDLIERIKNFQTVEELTLILEEVSEFLQQFNTGLDK